MKKLMALSLIALASCQAKGQELKTFNNDTLIYFSREKLPILKIGKIVPTGDSSVLIGGWLFDNPDGGWFEITDYDSVNTTIIDGNEGRLLIAGYTLSELHDISYYWHRSNDIYNTNTFPVRFTK